MLYTWSWYTVICQLYLNYKKEKETESLEISIFISGNVKLDNFDLFSYWEQLEKLDPQKIFSKALRNSKIMKNYQAKI